MCCEFYLTDAPITIQIYEETQAVLSENENPELQSLKSEEDEGTLDKLNKTDEALGKNKGKMAYAIREMCQAIEKGKEEVEDTLNHLGIHLSPLLTRFILEKIYSPSLDLRFFQWAKLKPGFKHDTPSCRESQVPSYWQWVIDNATGLHLLESFYMNKLWVFF